MEGFRSLLRKSQKLKQSKIQPDSAVPKDHQLGEAYTLKLPPEIFIAIFGLLDRNSKDLVRVTGVCGRWRAIAIQSPEFWTNISVSVNLLSIWQTREYLDRISIFLSRSGDLPLDVEWHADGNWLSIPHFLDLFRQKGTFSRWRTLTLALAYHANYLFASLRDIDNFSNLESLILIYTPPYDLLDLISRTVTAKLHTLELGPLFQSPPVFVTSYHSITVQVKTIKVCNGASLRAVLPFPRNVTTMNADTMPDVRIDHIRHIFVRRISLRRLSRLNPFNLVTLIIALHVEAEPTQFTIVLPNLLWLAVKGVSFHALSFFKTWSLHTLSIECLEGETQALDGRLITAIRNGFEAPKLLILFLNIYMDGPATLEVLMTFPDISRVDIRFRNTDSGRDILLHVFPRERGLALCSNLDLLRVKLDVPPANELEWRQFLKETARRIGDPLWLLESKWRGGGYSKQRRPGITQRVPCIYPWREGE